MTWGGPFGPPHFLSSKNQTSYLTLVSHLDTKFRFFLLTMKAFSAGGFKFEVQQVVRYAHSIFESRNLAKKFRLDISNRGFSSAGC